MTDYISIKQVIDNCMAHPLLRDLTLERAVAYAVDFIRILQMPPMFIEKVEEVEIEDWRGQLPCDYFKMIQVRLKDRETNCKELYQRSNRVFRYSTDSFHMSEHKTDNPELTYKLQGRTIFTSIKEGTVEIAYEAIAVDGEGYPMIPDNSSLTRALELYIKKQCFTILFDLGKIPQPVLQNTQQEYSFAVAQAQSDIIRPSIDEMEAITNSLNTLLPRVNEHRRGFATLGNKEFIKKH